MIKSLPNLLIVDDNEVNLIFLEAILGNLKVNLIKAESGFEALEKSKGRELALAILDIQMPGMNGFELAVKLNEDKGANKVPIIFVTANHVNDIDVSKGYVSGAVDYIFKPVNVHILLSKVNVFLDLFNHKQTIIEESELLEKNAEKLVWANAALKKSEEKYRSYIDNAPDGVFISDKTGRFIEVNEAASRITGYSKDDLLSMSFTDLLSEGSINEGIAYFRKLVSGDTLKVELLFQVKNGAKRWWAIESVKLSKDRFLGFAKDITQRRLAEDQLRESESSLEDAQRIAQVGSWEWDMILGKVRWSKEMFRIYDIDPGTYDGSPETLFKVLHPEDVGKFTNSMNRNLAVGDLPMLEYRVIHKDGSIHSIFAEGRVETDNSGKPVRSVGTVKDITEQKRIEQELKNNLNALNETGKIAKVGGWSLNLTTGISTWTDETFRIFEIDLTEDEPLLTENLNFYVPTSRLILEDALQRAIQYGEPWDLESEIITTKGNRRWVHTIGKAYHENGKTESLSGAIQDITDRRQATDLLVQTQQNYETFFNTIDDFLIVLDLQGNIIHANKTSIERLGYSTEELLGNPVTLLHPAEYRDEIRKIIDKILIREVNFSPFPFLSKSGEYISVETKASHGLWNGNPAIFGVSKDITQIQISEEKFSKIFYLNPSACGLSELGTGHYLDVNEAFHKLFGFNKNEAIGKSPADLGIISPENLETLMLIIDSSEKTDNIEVSLIARNGDVKHVLLSADIIHIQDNKYRFTVAQDVTELKEIEHTLKISEEKYRTMLNASPDGILLIDLKGIITEVSEIGFELFDADNRDDLVGKDFYQFIPPDETTTIKDIFEKTVIEGLVQNAELKIRKKSQSTFQSEISSTLIQAPDGEPLSFMITIRDISQRKKIETKQIHADRMANLGEMASGIAHEINQPLNIISMVMDKILFETDKKGTIDIEFLKTKSDKIFDNITRIRNIIDHVRAFSRSDSNYLLTAFDINSSIENAVSMITEQYKHLDINLKTQLNLQLPQIVGNTFKFEQVIVNLLTNAKDAVLERRRIQEDYCELKVEIKTYQENQSLIVEITDNGTGIDKDDIHNIMLPFYTTKEEGKGTGLGLSICYQIIKEMHGTIDISSDGVNGTKIKLVLDIQKTN